MAILTLTGRTAIAASLKEQQFHLAWGEGLAAWDMNPEPEPLEASGLVLEIGRRAATQVAFCVPDEGGDIIIPSGRYRVVDYPTANIYTRFNFDFQDSPTAVIREVGIFVGTQVDPSLPAGQRYYLPNQVQNPGYLLVLERFEKFTRSTAVRQAFEFVTTI